MKRNLLLVASKKLCSVSDCGVGKLPEPLERALQALHRRQKAVQPSGCIAAHAKVLVRVIHAGDVVSAQDVDVTGYNLQAGTVTKKSQRGAVSTLAAENSKELSEFCK